MTGPAGLAKGVAAFIVAWLAALVIAVLTGASAVVILLAAGLVGLIAAALAGVLALRHAVVESVTTADVATVGDELVWVVHASSRSPIHAELRVGGAVVGRGWIRAGRTELIGTTPRRGVHAAVDVRWSSAGRLGLVWWKRSATVAITPLAVAPVSADAPAPAEQRRSDPDGESVAGMKHGRDDLDGVRQWRDGDNVNSVHWPSTLRSGELVVRQHVRAQDEQWIVHARTGTGDADAEAARVRHSLERGLAAGARVAVRVDDADSLQLTTHADVLRWSAAFDQRVVPPTRPSWWRRPIGGSSPEPTTALTSAARWAVAAASVTPLVMLLGPLGYGPTEMVVVVAAIAGAAAFSARTGERLRLLRQLVGLAVAVLVGAVLIDFSAITSVVGSLRFLLPQLLVVLVVMQGFECIDRRAGRVSLACAGLVTAYAAGIRVDGALGVWLLLATVGIAGASQAISHVDRRPSATTARANQRLRTRSAVVRIAGVAIAATALLGMLAVVPVPRGPAQLTLPSWLQERRPTGSSGGLAAPDGSPLLGGAGGNGGSRSGGSTSGSGGSGGYPGFSPTMDTSLRGDLGDTVVLRVRAPFPDFWRGQTFTRFDGRTWYVDERLGTRSDGPEHSIQAADGDVRSRQPGDFIQSFYAEVDLPNIVFAAGQPDRVLLDAPLWQRPDGALRADVVLPEGSAYTVVSRRSGATADLLRAEGNFRGAPAAYIDVPASTSARTRALARRLASGSSSRYDTIIAIQDWLGSHVTYDLDAPVPPKGADAVDDFLFESHRGFCEQIASATAIMLRSLDIPARVATGYVPGERDEVAGVWVSRARDAHAWVEVRFPNYGWVAFDPTASVPLSGEAEQTTIGGDLVNAVIGVIAGHIAEVILAGLIGLVAVVTGRAVGELRRRRRRGRWGVLQDRFVAAAVQRGASPTAANASLASVFDDPAATALADALDESAFSAGWHDDDEVFQQVTLSLRQLERYHGR